MKKFLICSLLTLFTSVMAYTAVPMDKASPAQEQVSHYESILSSPVIMPAASAEYISSDFISFEQINKAPIANSVAVTEDPLRLRSRHPQVLDDSWSSYSCAISQVKHFRLIRPPLIQ